MPLKISCTGTFDFAQLFVATEPLVQDPAALASEKSFVVIIYCCCEFNYVSLESHMQVLCASPLNLCSFVDKRRQIQDFVGLLCNCTHEYAHQQSWHFTPFELGNNSGQIWTIPSRWHKPLCLETNIDLASLLTMFLTTVTHRVEFWFLWVFFVNECNACAQENYS